MFTVTIDSQGMQQSFGPFALRAAAHRAVVGLLNEYMGCRRPVSGIEDYSYRTTDSRGYPVHIRIVPISTTVCKEVA